MKKVRLFFYLLLLAGICNLYSMQAPRIDAEEKEQKTAYADSAGALGDSATTYAEISSSLAIERALEELAKFPIRSVGFIDLLHTWAREAQIDYLRAAFERYRNVKVFQCNNRYNKSLLDSAEKAPIHLVNKSMCLEYLANFVGISNLENDSDDDLGDYSGDDSEDDEPELHVEPEQRSVIIVFTDDIA